MWRSGLPRVPSRAAGPLVAVTALVVVALTVGATGGWLAGGGEATRSAVVVRGDDYPFKRWSPAQADEWGAGARSCTSFVAWRMNQALGRAAAPWAFDLTTMRLPDGTTVDFGGRGLGDAATWGARAAAAGVRVDDEPSVGSVAQWDAYEAGPDGIEAGSQGHVAWVVAVDGFDGVLIEEYNAWEGYDARTASAPRYLHFLDP